MKREIIASFACVVLLLGLLCLPNTQAHTAGQEFSAATEEMSYKAKISKDSKPIISVSLRVTGPTACKVVATTNRG